MGPVGGGLGLHCHWGWSMDGSICNAILCI